MHGISGHNCQRIVFYHLFLLLAVIKNYNKVNAIMKSLLIFWVAYDALKISVFFSVFVHFYSLAMSLKFPFTLGLQHQYAFLQPVDKSITNHLLLTEYIGNKSVEV